MPRHIDPPKTLKERYGTMRAYFKATADTHNGMVYKDFLARVNPGRKHKVPVPVAAEDFNVSPKTWYSWRKWHTEEQEAKVAEQPAD